MMKYLLVLVFLYFVCITAKDGKETKEKDGRKPSGKKIAMRQSGDIDITIRSVSVSSRPHQSPLHITWVFCSAGGSGALRSRAGPCVVPWLGNTVNILARDSPVSITSQLI